MLFLCIWDILRTLGVCDVTDGPKRLELYKSDLNIRFPVQINLPIQSLQHLAAFLVILCCFYIF